MKNKQEFAQIKDIFAEIIEFLYLPLLTKKGIKKYKLTKPIVQ